ncbi:5-formyltetrahydrofolate cyclo-ligase [Thalassoglobus polymorphus]|uniref:5-formyltetrahydrofolate cyclo-ligase n=1 Tax=Thalassoglobus polymorphus TaxID=2527994 RepID=A0A517QPZ1_9PLAN|nr:5-formyltetrahydrofolate cyclo-ligase [Thalassoglobus polymorphus]QDT33709.1 putative 5-formyltetrahydrofolate cyclo-ligase [Thalassoglobus polymorphus]
MSEPESTDSLKQAIRRQLRQLRREQTQKDQVSQKILDRVFTLEQYEHAKTVLYYVDARDEVRTLSSMEAALAGPKQIVVPYCDQGELRLVEIKNRNELSPGAYGILEPTSAVQKQNDRSINPERIDFALIPGLGFDAGGTRIGHGKGYYDKLLPHLRPDCLRCGIAYDCQIIESLPKDKHDQPMNIVVTQTRLMECKKK